VKPVLICSFCGKSQKETKKLIAGPTVSICDECVDLCNAIIAEEKERAAELTLTEHQRRQIWAFLVDMNQGVLDFLADIGTEETNQVAGRSDAAFEFLVRAPHAAEASARALQCAWGRLPEEENRAAGQLARVLVVLLTAAAGAGVPLTRLAATLSGPDKPN
jgi:hypothetical protein